MLAPTVAYYRALYYYWVRGGRFIDCPVFESRRARCHVYSLALIPDLWSRPHYRNGDFREDMRKNLRDVAVPGTGIPLSVFAVAKPLTYFFLLVLYPLICLVAALNRAVRPGRVDPEQSAEAARAKSFPARVSACYTEQLLEPRDWFSFWRLNCRLATLHSSVTGETDYGCEDKWTFLTKAKELGVAVSPFMEIEGIVCKHRNEEGGLGFCSFRNAAAGGDWIIQRKLQNGPFLSSLLPERAPLSTFRIISASRGGLKSGVLGPAGVVVRDDIRALSCVWRAGRKDALTDHSAVLFNVDPITGIIKKGTSNVHWYQRGPLKPLSTPWLSTHGVEAHPDTGKRITGTQVPNMQAIMDFVCDAHLKLCPHVPMCGWDVALTENEGMLLLEGNFSCNFFRGDFDQDWYFEFVEDYFTEMERLQMRGETANPLAGQKSHVH